MLCHKVQYKMENASGGVRTHEDFRPTDLKSAALDHSATNAIALIGIDHLKYLVHTQKAYQNPVIFRKPQLPISLINIRCN